MAGPEAHAKAADPLSAPRPKILRILTRLNVGGPARHVLFLADGMREAWETVLAVGTPDRGEGGMDDLARELGVLPLKVPSLRRGVHPLSDLRAFLALWRLCRKLKPDVVHTHTSKAGALGRVAARLAGVPVVLHTFHGHVFRGYFGPGLSGMVLLAERMLAKLSTRIYAVTASQKEELVSLGVAPAEKIRVIPLGLDLDALKDLPARGGSPPVIGCVARLVPIKGHDVLMEAFRRLKTEARLVLFGDGPLRKDLEAMAPPGVRFEGWRKDLREVYGAMDLCVLASINEGSPVALIEAAAAGVPIVATRVGGVANVLEGHPAAVLVPPSDAGALAKGIEEALADLEGRKARAREAAPRWRSRYDRGRLAADLLQEYADLRA